MKCEISDLEEYGVNFYGRKTKSVLYNDFMLQVTPVAAECYRRGFLYLKDMAISNQVPILDDMSLALDYLIQKVRLGLNDVCGI